MRLAARVKTARFVRLAVVQSTAKTVPHVLLMRTISQCATVQMALADLCVKYVILFQKIFSSQKSKKLKFNYIIRYWRMLFFALFKWRYLPRNP